MNAGVSHDRRETVGQASNETFVRVMVTNALSPMRVIERLESLVPSTGTIALMSSGLGSVTENDAGGWEVYRASKAAVNTLMRSFVARHPDDKRRFLLIAPGWVRTDMGGKDALLDIETSIPGVVDVVMAAQPGLHFKNYQGKTVRW